MVMAKGELEGSDIIEACLYISRILSFLLALMVTAVCRARVGRYSERRSLEAISKTSTTYASDALTAIGALF